MKTKRFLAVLLALVMALALVPYSAFAGGEKTAEPDAADKGSFLQNYLNYDGTYINYSNDSNYSIYGGRTYVDGEEIVYVETGTVGMPNTTTWFATETFPMEEGETLSFMYWFQTEQNYDKFMFAVDGSNAIVQSGNSGGGSEPQWQSYTFTAYTSKEYTFRWTYQKDSSQDYGADLIKVARVTYSAHRDHYLLRAALSPTGNNSAIEKIWDVGDYPLKVVEDTSAAHPLYISSGNAGIANSSSDMWAYVTVKGASVENPVSLVFDMKYSTEANYDKVYFTVNGAVIFEKSGTNDPSWHQYTYEITTEEMIRFAWFYSKDGSQNAGEDMFAIDNLRLTGLSSMQRAESFEGLNYFYSDAELTFNTPFGEHGFIMTEWNGNPVAASNNRFLDDSDAEHSISYIETTVNMAAGETFFFNYKVYSEEGADIFSFYANDEFQFSDDGWKHSNSWNYFFFTANQTRSYTFRWEYVKDESESQSLDCVYIANVKYTGSHHNELTVENTLPSPDNYADLYVTNGSGILGFHPEENGVFGNIVVSGNRYYENTTSQMYVSTAWLSAGDRIEFEYRVSAESYDVLDISVKKAGDPSFLETLSVDGSPNAVFATYSFTAANAGAYIVKFEFTKDSMVDGGDDCAMLRNFRIVRAGMSLDEALNVPGGSLHFTANPEGSFIGMNMSGNTVAVSTIEGQANTTANLETTVYVNAGDIIAFEYYVSTEQNYDTFGFWVNGERVLTQSGDHGWGDYSYTVTNSGNYTFKWTYSKDSSVNGNNDYVMLDNVAITAGSAPVLIGDVDGDGQVSTGDALLVLRYALGIISANALDVSAADVDGDGDVDTGDALIILRRALGIGA